jgi:aldehyde dehydrogenase (NAD+)
MVEVDVSSSLVQRLRNAYANGRTRPLAWRRFQLQQMKRLLREHEADLLQALRADLGKPELEAWEIDIASLSREIDDLLKHLADWAAPQPVHTPLAAMPGRAAVLHEPLGVVLVIGTWNNPVYLLLLPAAGAIAAGNAVVVKPSEIAPRTADVLSRLLPKYMDEQTFAVVQGGIPETQDLLEQKFDHIFFTGGAQVGRLVMNAAAKHPTPVTLELGGKNPAIVDQDADIAVAARRIAWGKFLNAGQTCTSPDYVLVHTGVEEEFLMRIVAAIRAFYGPHPRQSADFGRIVNAGHFQRVVRLLESKGATIVIGGESDADQRYVAPTVLRNVAADAPVMTEETFGPVLPVLAVRDVEAAIEFVNARPKPLVLYLFCEAQRTIDRVGERTSSGTLSVNAIDISATIPGLPFGGVGESGMGASHGRDSFETFSHRKALFVKPARPELGFLYPPYTAVKRWLLRQLY